MVSGQRSPDSYPFNLHQSYNFAAKLRSTPREAHCKVRSGPAKYVGARGQNWGAENHGCLPNWLRGTGSPRVTYHSKPLVTEDK